MKIFDRLISLTKKRFIKDVGVLQIGSFVNASMSFLVSVVYARILGVDGYAQYILIFTFFGLMNLFTNWGEQGVVLTLAPEYLQKQEKEKLKEVIIYYFFVTTFSTLIISIVALIFAPQLSFLLYHDVSIGLYARVIFVMAIFQIFSFFVYAILQVMRHIKKFTSLDVFDKAAQIIFPALMVVAGLGLWGLVWGKMIMAVISASVAIIIYCILAKRFDYLPSFGEMISNLRFKTIRKYFRFGVGVSLDKNIGNLWGLLPILLLGHFGTVSMVAFYKLGYSYINLPALFLGPAAQLLSVQLPKSKAYGQHILRRDFWRSTVAGGLINLLMVCGLTLLAWPLVYFFYGADFLGSVKVIYYLAIAVALSGFSLGFGPILKTMRKIRVAILVNLSLVVLCASIFFVLYRSGMDALMAILIATVLSTVYDMALLLFLIDRYLKAEDKKIDNQTI